MNYGIIAKTRYYLNLNCQFLIKTSHIIITLVTSNNNKATLINITSNINSLGSIYGLIWSLKLINPITILL